LVTLGEPLDGRYDIVLDDSPLDVPDAPISEISNTTETALSDVDERKTERGYEYSIDLESETLHVKGAISIGFESATVTRVKYSLPQGDFTLSWLRSQNGLYIDATT
jgi:hypothetical protein